MACKIISSESRFKKCCFFNSLDRWTRCAFWKTVWWLKVWAEMESLVSCWHFLLAKLSQKPGWYSPQQAASRAQNRIGKGWGWVRTGKQDGQHTCGVPVWSTGPSSSSHHQSVVTSQTTAPLRLPQAASASFWPLRVLRCVSQLPFLPHPGNTHYSE